MPSPIARKLWAIALLCLSLKNWVCRISEYRTKTKEPWILGGAVLAPPKIQGSSEGLIDSPVLSDYARTYACF